MCVGVKCVDEGILMCWQGHCNDYVDYGVECHSCEWRPSTTQIRQVKGKFMGVLLRRRMPFFMWIDSVRQIATKLRSVRPLLVVGDIGRSRILVYIFL